MFDFVRKHTRIFLGALILLIIPSFVFLGLEGYSRNSQGGNTTVASVAGKKISQAEWDAAHREQAERLRRQMPNVDNALLDSAELRAQSLEALVRERVMLHAADKLHLVITDDRLQKIFASDPQFAFLRNPDGSANKDALAAQGLSSEVLAQRLRQDLSMRQVVAGLSGTAVAPAAAASAALDALFEQREVQVQRFDPKDFLSQVNPSDADLETYYKDPTHSTQFQAPEQASIEYVMLDLEAVKSSLTASEDDLRKYYAENQARYSVPEERRASHILIKADKDTDSADRAKAKAKAEALLADLNKAPPSFADLARKNSEDPGSAQSGGDLDFFARGAMVKPFEDAAFKLKKGEISGVVESDFGYHIIQLTDKRGGETRSFEAARPELLEEVRKQLAQRRYAELAVEFTNMVFEQPDSLKPVAEKFKLKLRSVQGVVRTPAANVSTPLNNRKFLESLFGSDSLTNKRNTEAIEVGANQLVSGRIVQHAPAHQLPLVEVSIKVRDNVVAERAASLARKTGEERLTALQKSPQTALTDPALVVSRAQSRELPRQVVDAILRAPTVTLPSYVGVNLAAQGYALVKLTKVLGRDPAASDPRQGMAQYTQAWADAESQAYFAALKSRFKVDKTALTSAASASAR